MVLSSTATTASSVSQTIFRWATLEVGGSTVTFHAGAGGFNGDAVRTVGRKRGRVVRTGNLIIDPGSLLIISNNVELYYKSVTGVTGIGVGTLSPGDNVLLLDGSSFHPITTIVAVPEPSVLVLWALGGLAIYYRKRKFGVR